MMNQKLSHQLLNLLYKQITMEFEAEKKYLAIYCILDNTAYKNFSKWFYKQAQEEREHAYKIINFLLELGVDVRLEDVKSPSFESISDCDPVNLFNLALESEQNVTKSIETIYEKALADNNSKVSIFLQWFITEQIEEENQVNNILDMISPLNINSLILFDQNFKVED